MNILTFAMCRMQPPTRGHMNIIDALQYSPGDQILFLSQKQDSKDNPLSFEVRKEFLRHKYFNLNILPAANLFGCLEFLKGEYDIVNIVCGSDRYVEYHKFKKYESDLGYFINIIQCESDSRDKVSGTMLRNAVINNEKDQFIKLCMFDNYRSEQLYDLMRGLLCDSSFRDKCK